MLYDLAKLSVFYDPAVWRYTAKASIYTLRLQKTDLYTMNYHIRSATPLDIEGIIALLPRLAAFEVPEHRAAEDLWLGDKRLLEAWAEGHRNDVDVAVAIAVDAVVGTVVLSERSELLTGLQSAHIEVLALAEIAEGHGIGSALMNEAEAMAVRRNLDCISLNVFTNNERARALYERKGFDGEMMRYFKPLSELPAKPII